jgi:hypothetical protein
VVWSLANDLLPSTASASVAVPPVQCAVYFENAIIRTEGNLQPTLLRDGGRSTFLVATCCNSVVAISHPAYGGKVFMVIEAAARIKGVDEDILLLAEESICSLNALSGVL